MIINIIAVAAAVVLVAIVLAFWVFVVFFLPGSMNPKSKKALAVLGFIVLVVGVLLISWWQPSTWEIMFNLLKRYSAASALVMVSVTTLAAIVEVLLLDPMRRKK